METDRAAQLYISADGLEGKRTILTFDPEKLVKFSACFNVNLLKMYLVTRLYIINIEQNNF